MGAMTCKIKHFILLTFIVCLTSLVICFYGNDQQVNQNLQHFVKQTHKHFETFKENLQSASSNANKLQIEDKYLNLYGFNNFISKSESYINELSSTSTNKNTSLHVTIVSSVTKQQSHLLFGFINNIHKSLPTKEIVIWNTEPNQEDLVDEVDSEFTNEIRHYCNSSLCNVEVFNYNNYPDYVKDLKAHKPFIIQAMLSRRNNEGNPMPSCILWLNLDKRLVKNFNDSVLNKFLSLINDGGTNGIIGWSKTTNPTSTLTHPKMFTYFNTKSENYYFHRMIDLEQLLICNTKIILGKVMLPWIKCTLIKDCISPFGSQSNGCRFDKKPMYRYSGCHGYDTSALNVILGIEFPLHQPYISRAIITKSVSNILVNQTANL